MKIHYLPYDPSQSRHEFSHFVHFPQMARPAVSLQLRHLEPSFGWGKLRTAGNLKISAISDFQSIHPNNTFFFTLLSAQESFFWHPRMAVDFSKKTSWAEPAWAGLSRPEPARGAIGWIFSRFWRKIKNTKGFCRFWEDFHSFSKILLAKSPARASQPSKTYGHSLDFLYFSWKSTICL